MPPDHSTPPRPARRASGARQRASGQYATPPLYLHALTPANGHQLTGAPHDGARLVAFRDIAAVVTEAPVFAAEDASPESLARHRAIVDAVFRHHEVLPAPPGTVFRAEEILLRWMELHYVSLSDALEFFQDRRAARVHMCKPTRHDDGGDDSDVAELAADSLRALRRSSAASVSLRLQHMPDAVVSSAFLVDTDLWEAFVSTAKAQADAAPSLRVIVTGPWPPYDFVQMQFGG